MRFGDFDGFGRIYDDEGKLLLQDDEDLWMAIVPNGRLTARLPFKLMKHRATYITCGMGIHESSEPRKELSDIDKIMVSYLDMEHQAIDQRFYNQFPTPILVTSKRIVRLRCAIPSRQLLLSSGYMPGIAAEWHGYESDVWQSKRRIYGEVRWDEILRAVVADYGVVLILKPGTRVLADYTWRYKTGLDTVVESDSWIEAGIRYPKQLFQLKAFLRIADMLGIPIQYSGTGAKRWHQFRSVFHFEDSPVEAGLLDSSWEPVLMSGERVVRSYRAMGFVYWPRKTGGSRWRKHEFLPPDWFNVVETSQRIIMTRMRSDKDTRYRAFESGSRIYLSFDKRRLRQKMKDGVIRLKLHQDKRNRVIARLVRNPTPKDVERHERRQEGLQLWQDKVFKKFKQPVGATKAFSEIPFPREAFKL